MQRFIQNKLRLRLKIWTKNLNHPVKIPEKGAITDSFYLGDDYFIIVIKKWEEENFSIYR